MPGDPSRQQCAKMAIQGAVWCAYREWPWINAYTVSEFLTGGHAEGF